MDKFLNNCKEFMKDEEGLTVVEYVIGAALLVLAITTVFTNLGTLLQGKLEAIIGNIGDGSTPT
ncbi:Flp family type IVb pilin [Vibrio splendidus]|uniref:Flp family type IVb pilin n=1 Tax=Vibrio splendidus TaxID=29497 RepID=UPI0024693B61|nr:Flp family type IVb pilin [Vibrio splendidus]MDH5929714.1 Flp family type IVb pilin [Vibrio splendidus]